MTLRTQIVAALIAVAYAASPASVLAAAVSTTTSTTLPISPTTTLGGGNDVSGGGRFKNGFGPGGSDVFYFSIVSPVVLATETSDGADACPGDTIMELRQDGSLLASDDDSGPARCSRIEYALTDIGDYEIHVAGFGGVRVSPYILDVEFFETVCGNGVVEILEECDDGNFDTGDCCAADCTKDPDTTPCDDGLLCNGDDSCADGICNVHTANPCPGVDGDSNCAESCSDEAPGCTWPDPEASPCDDGLFCNGADTCNGGNCIVHAGDPCRGPDGDGRCTESCKESLDTCTAADPSGTPCDDGLFCNGPDTCFGGLCSQHAGHSCVGADGDGNCSESCNEATDKCNGADPNGSDCDDGLFCTGLDACMSGSCSFHTGSGCPGADDDNNCVESCNEAAKDCSANDANGAPCDDGVFCNGADSCSNGACTVHAGNPCPGPDGDGSCSESCDEIADSCTAADPDESSCDNGLFCDGTDTCSGGTCTIHTGNPCQGADGDDDCAESCSETLDHCAAADPGGSACDDGLFCNGDDTCSGGACVVHTGSPCPDDDGDDNCAESCNEDGDDCSAADSNGAPCDDGLFCNGSDTCSGGTCSVHAGSPCADADGDGNCAESCDEDGDTCTAADPDGSACTDGVFCNGSDTCQAGSCSVHAGNPCAGADGDGDCSESCNEVGDVCTAADADGASCDDGLFCNGSDTCQGGTCSQHAGEVCPGPDEDENCSESCDETADACTAGDSDGVPCDDGVFCNGADTCQAGSCSVHAGNPCPGTDGDGNCSETCDEAADSCTAADDDATACDDGVFCNGADTCVSGSCTSHAGNPCVGSDGDSNCSESCDETADACTGADPDETVCDDGLLCNGADSCLGGFCVEHAGNPCPGADGDSDCAESCSDSGGGCSGDDPADSPCDDGVFCNGADTCLNGSCSVHAGNPCPGADGDGQCAESCNETSATCDAPDPNGSACDDGLFCNGADTCTGGLCTSHVGDPCPGADGDDSCSESCDEGSDSCDAADPDGAACDDGSFCNGSDQCASGLCSIHAGDPCPGADADGNCSESCNEEAGDCSAADPGGSACNDDLFCNGTDACTAGACDSHEGDPCLGADGDGNCAESCSEAADACVGADANGTICDDGLFCNGTDTCLDGACSEHTGSPCPDADGDADCAESCNETDDSCDADDASGSPCNDDLFCNGSDQCMTGLCVGSAEADCDDGKECTEDTCFETLPHCTNTPIPDCVPSTICGDANGDERITAGDALNVLRAAVGGPECDLVFCACDVNANGSVAAGDALAVLRFAVGIPLDLTCEC